jgi:hypothetical protein
MKQNEIELQANVEFEKIEYQYSHIYTEFKRKMSIWESIAEEINDSKGTQKKVWHKVMDLYNKKYK